MSWKQIAPPSAAVTLAKRAASESSVLYLEIISGRDTWRDTLAAADGDALSKSYDLPSLRPYCVRGVLKHDGQTTHSGVSSTVFVEPAKTVPAELTLNPLYAHLRFSLGTVPAYVTASSLKVWAGNSDEPKSGTREVAFDIPIATAVVCSLGVFGDVWGHVQSEAWAGKLEIPALSPGESRNLTALLKWQGIAPVPGALDLRITVVQTGTVMADVVLDGHPLDRDGDAIPDSIDICPDSPVITCGQDCPLCDKEPGPIPLLVNLFYNPEPESRTYPRVGDHSAGWGGGSLSGGSQFDMVDSLVGYTDTWARGLAFTGGLTGWAGQSCGERFVIMELDGSHEIHGVDAYWHGDYHIPATFNYEVFDGSAWRTAFATVNRNGGAYIVDSLEYKGAGWASKPTVVHFAQPVTGSKVRMTLNNCEMATQVYDSHGWLYDLRVWGIQ